MMPSWRTCDKSHQNPSLQKIPKESYQNTNDLPPSSYPGMMLFIMLNPACFNADMFMGMVMRRMVLTMIYLVVVGQSQPTYPWRICQDFNG